jgi:glycosyltransferase involved in cell wall biosynthesis
MSKPNPRTILLVGTQMAVGGSQMVLLQLAGWFHAQGYHVVTAFFYDRDGLTAVWQERYPFRLIDLQAWKKSFALLKPLWLVRGLWRLFSLMRRQRFSAVLAFTHHSNLLTLPLAWLAGIPVRVASHHGRILGFPRWQERLHAWVINSGIATCLAAVSEQVRLESIEEGVRPAKIRVIPNGVSLTTVKKTEIQHLRRGAGVPPKGYLIVSAGRLWPEKGHIHLVRAMPAVVEQLPRTVLAIAGDGVLRSELEAEARALGVADHIRFLGVRSDVRYWFAAADLFVLPSNSEGMPMALLEAMGMGAPVVATRVGGVPELVRDGETGRLVPPQNPSALAEVMVSLLRNKSERIRLAQNGQTYVMRYYSVERMYERYARLLDPASFEVNGE